MPRELSPQELATIENRHTYHPPKDDEARQAHEQIREILKDAEIKIHGLLPGPSRCASLFSTSMDQARMWANMAIATQDGAKQSGPS